MNQIKSDRKIYPKETYHAGCQNWRNKQIRAVHVFVLNVERFRIIGVLEK